jgi:hypothetical protein
MFYMHNVTDIREPSLRVEGCICDTIEEVSVFVDNSELEALLSKIHNMSLTPSISPLQLLFRTLSTDASHSQKSKDKLESNDDLESPAEDLHDENVTFMGRVLMFVTQFIHTLAPEFDDGYERLVSAIAAPGHPKYESIVELLMSIFDLDEHSNLNQTERKMAFTEFLGKVPSLNLVNTPHLKLNDKTLFWTKQHYMGLTTQGTLPGDLVCVLAGCDFPVVLRRDGEMYRHVGPCFVHGLMNGEAAGMVQKGTSKMQEFIIR